MKSRLPKTYYDHKGNSFPTLAAMCKKYHIDTLTYKSRAREGLSLRECLLGEDPYKREALMSQQTNYFELDDEIKRLEMKVAVLSKCKLRLSHAGLYPLRELTNKVEEAGLAVSSAISYANSISK